PDGQVMHKFVCKVCVSRKATLLRADYEDLTGNLKRHITICKPVDTPEAQIMEDFAKGVTYSWPRIRYLIALWCACRHRPFSIVEDQEFQAILQMLYPKVRLPSRFTVSRDIRMACDVTKDAVIQMFKVCALLQFGSKVHICVDGWTSPNVFTYLGVTAHWHHNGEIRHIILEFLRCAAGLKYACSLHALN
ncbi:hypothetical protein K466DRAFT_502393, partial [Polyporus arcularius HHB13444]